MNRIIKLISPHWSMIVPRTGIQRDTLHNKSTNRSDILNTTISSDTLKDIPFIGLTPFFSFPMLHGKIYNIDKFKKTNLPIIVGQLDENQKKSLNLNYSNKYHFILDMPIKFGNSGIYLPSELDKYYDIIKKIITIQFSYEPYQNIYINIDERPVHPFKSQRRPGWHSDSYRPDFCNTHRIVEDTIYIVYNSIPTKFTYADFHLDKINYKDDDNVLEYFNKRIEEFSTITYPNYTILKLTPYCVHAPDYNLSDKIVNRKFLKIVFSNEKYNLEGNTINPHIQYPTDWYWIKRKPTRNTPFEKFFNKKNK